MPSLGYGYIIEEKESSAVQYPALDPLDENVEGRQHSLDGGLDLPALISTLLTRSEDVMARLKQPQQLAKLEADPLIRDTDWNEEEPLNEWRTVPRAINNPPPVLQAMLA